MQTRRQKVCREMQIEMPSNSQADILQRLIRRYLFKLERMKEEGGPTKVANTVQQIVISYDNLYSPSKHGRQKTSNTNLQTKSNN